MLTGQGEAYFVDLAVLDVLDGDMPQGASPFQPDTGLIGCLPTDLGPQPDRKATVADMWRQDLQEKIKATQARLPQAAAKGVAAKSSAPRQADTMVNVALNVFAFSGPVSITSKTHDTKWKDGWVNYKFAFEFESITEEVLSEIEAELGGKLPSVKASDLNKYKFQLFRSQP